PHGADGRARPPAADRLLPRLRGQRSSSDPHRSRRGQADRDSYGAVRADPVRDGSVRSPATHRRGSNRKGPQTRLPYQPSGGIVMDGAPDQADATFQRLLNREILLSERRRMLIVAALVAFILALILLASTFAPGFVRSIYHDRLPVRAAVGAF